MILGHENKLNASSIEKFATLPFYFDQQAFIYSITEEEKKCVSFMKVLTKIGQDH